MASSIVVVDGASGLSRQSVTGWASDAQWFSHRLAALIGEELTCEPFLLAPAVRHALFRLRLEFEEALGSPPAVARPDRSPADLPSASVAIARLTPTDLEFFSLGDCTTLIGHTDGAVESVHDMSVTRLDAAVISRMVQLAHANGTSVRAAREMVGEELRAHRMLMNQDRDGYWIADLTGVGVDHATTLRRRIDEIRDVALMTDGFAAACDILRLVDGPRPFLEALRTDGADMLGTQIVHTLDSDPDYERFPRLKHRDDMAVVHATVSAWVADANR
jgi:hypothetical protein